MADTAQVGLFHRGWGVVWWVVSLVVAVGLGVLFGRWVFSAPQVDDGAGVPATVVVSQMSVGRSLPTMVAATWPQRPFGVGAAQGVLTSVVVQDGASVKAGDVLFTVDLRPVVAGVGAVPAFRDLAAGAVGADVAQLQQLLVDTGFYSGAVNGVFKDSTRLAVRAWQKSLGVSVDGVVRAGDIVYANSLPGRVRMVDGVTVGDRLAPGDVVLSVMDGVPQFSVTVAQGSALDPTKPIEVMFGDQTVQTVVGSSRDSSNGYTIWTLTRADGTPVCADRCDLVPLNPDQAVYQARQVLTPQVSGPGVPAAAVWFNADGTAYLVTLDGVRLPVRILGEGQGGVVVDGVTIGVTVVLAGDTTVPVTTSAPTKQATPGGTPS